MDVTTSIEQVAGILHRAGLEFDTCGAGDEYLLLFEPAEAVFISFEAWGDAGVVITITSPVLQDIEPDGAGAAIVQSRLQEWNASHRFAKFLWSDGALLLAHDVLGDTLQAGELLNAVHGIAALATRLADELEHEVVGHRFRAVLEQPDLEEVEDE